MKKAEKFELLLDVSWVVKKEILTVDSNGTKVEIISLPTSHYKKWYWKILYHMSFKLLFVEKYTHTVKIL